MKDGGAAFPSSYWATSESDQPSFMHGMTLRDWFAGQALPALLENYGGGSDVYAAEAARASYRLADAMIAEGDIQLMAQKERETTDGDD